VLGTDFHQSVRVRFATKAVQRVSAVQGEAVPLRQRIPKLFKTYRPVRIVGRAKQRDHFSEDEDETIRAFFVDLRTILPMTSSNFFSSGRPSTIT